ncbi:MAG: amidohydrolase family protein [Pirellulaceae bacterium]|nr:amidohydrolase family protein [Pirellulaceae bacterium]
MDILARHFATARPVRLRIENSRIAALEGLPATAQEPHLPWVAPGLVDLQVNGLGGHEFNDPQLTSEHVLQISRQLDRDGVTKYLPTATTHSFELLAHSLATVAEACRQSDEVADRVAGIHLEGPYLSVEDGPRGAHPRQHCRPPDWDEFQQLQQAAQGRIRILTMSPEYEGSAEFVRRVADTGVLVAIGHTAAASDQIQAAVDAGARMSTHLGNGAHGQIRRHPNYIWDQLAEDRLVASLIVDGHHLPAAVVKSFVRAKTPQRCVLVSDITGMAGMPPGLYQQTSLGAVEVLDDGRLVIPGQRQLLAGASLPLSVGVGNVMRMAGVSLEAAIAMASQRPAELIGLPPVRLQVGDLADLLLFELPADGPLQVLATLNAGQVVFGQVP